MLDALEMLGPEELERYSRQMLLRPMGGTGQIRLKKGSILVLGAGGLGCPALLYLVTAGVGRVAISDPDRVELSNLGRQVLFHHQMIGERKAEAAARVLHCLNPNVKIDVLPERLDGPHLGRLVSACDVVIEATDSFDSKFAVNDLALKLGKTAVIGAVLGFSGQITTVRGGERGCYRCLFEGPPAADEARRCQDAGILGAVAGIMGALQALEAIKALLGVGDLLLRRILQLDGLGSGFRQVEFRPRPGCSACGGAGRASARF